MSYTVSTAVASAVVDPLHLQLTPSLPLAPLVPRGAVLGAGTRMERLGVGGWHVGTLMCGIPCPIMWLPLCLRYLSLYVPLSEKMGIQESHG